MDLFTPRETAWRPPDTLPDLSRHDELWVDFETDGLDAWRSHPVGLVVTTLDRSNYYPFGHNGGNLDPAQVKAWAAREFAHKTLIFSWAKFDVHMSCQWGLDFRTLPGVKFRDVQHQACLLNERRRKSGLDLLAEELLGKKKLVLPFDKSRMKDVHSFLAGLYAEEDGTLTRDVDLAQRPLITAENLDRVVQLEDSLIEVVVEMERNGAPLDLVKLARWRVEVRKRWEAGLRQLRDVAGFPVNPDSVKDMARLFSKFSIETPLDADTGQPTFAAAYLKPLRAQYPIVELAMRTRALGSLLSKYLDKYWAGHTNGYMRYNLHQLRADDKGTITGRFSCSGVSDKEGANMQQVYHPEKQEEKLGTDEFAVRELFVHSEPIFEEGQPRPKRQWVSADAKQIEYRIFARLSRNKDVLATYARNPHADFHQVVTEMIQKINPTYTRKKTKNVNFCKLFGGGVRKIARMVECGYDEAVEFVREYDRAFPEVGQLIADVEAAIRRRAQPLQAGPPHERGARCGYVKTWSGRKRRYPELDRLHSGLNAYIQGTAADINKLKLREIYDAREDLALTMRFTVHDSNDGDQDPIRATPTNFRNCSTPRSFRRTVCRFSGTSRSARTGRSFTKFNHSNNRRQRDLSQ